MATVGPLVLETFGRNNGPAPPTSLDGNGYHARPA